jgi:hypothetical protein
MNACSTLLHKIVYNWPPVIKPYSFVRCTYQVYTRRHCKALYEVKETVEEKQA